MKAFSILQPWAWLIVNGHKDVENRSWRPQNPGLHFRGEALIHAGKRFDQDGLDWVRGEFPWITLPETFDRGGIVGKARFMGVVKEHDSPWFFGPYAFLIADAKPLPFRPCAGALGFFTPEFDQSNPLPSALSAARSRCWTRPKACRPASPTIMAAPTPRARPAPPTPRRWTMTLRSDPAQAQDQDAARAQRAAVAGPATILDDRFLTLVEVRAIFSVGNTTIYRWIDERGFPRPIRFSAKVARWRLSEITAWLNRIQPVATVEHGEAR